MISSWRRTCVLFAIVVGWLLSSAACQRDDSFLLVEVAGNLTLAPAQLRATVVVGLRSSTFFVPPEPAAISLPTSFTVELDRSITGPVIVIVEALDGLWVVARAGRDDAGPHQHGRAHHRRRDPGDAAVTLGLPVINDQNQLPAPQQAEPDARDGDPNDWRWQLRNRLPSKEEIAARMALTPEEEAGLEAAPGNFRVAITPYYFSLIDPERPSCPVRMQVIPRARELDIEPGDLVDPLGEDSHSPGDRRSFTAIPTAACCWRSTAARSTAGTATAAAWSASRSRRSRARISSARSTTSGGRRRSATC